MFSCTSILPIFACIARPSWTMARRDNPYPRQQNVRQMGGIEEDTLESPRAQPEDSSQGLRILQLARARSASARTWRVAGGREEPGPDLLERLKRLFRFHP